MQRTKSYYKTMQFVKSITNALSLKRQTFLIQIISLVYDFSD